VVLGLHEHDHGRRHGSRFGEKLAFHHRAMPRVGAVAVMGRGEAGTLAWSPASRLAAM
jgi:hypothetical protein